MSLQSPSQPGKGSEVCPPGSNGKIQEGFLEEAIWSSVFKEKLQGKEEKKEF